MGNQGSRENDFTKEIDEQKKYFVDKHGDPIKFSSEEVKIRDLKPGDHLAVKCLGFYHHGILLEVMEGVADFGRTMKEGMKIKLADLAEFMKGSTLLRINYPEGACLDPKVTVYKARKFVKNPDLWEEYSLMRNNCEHFAVFCKTGVASSRQSRQ